MPTASLNGISKRVPPNEWMRGLRTLLAVAAVTLILGACGYGGTTIDPQKPIKLRKSVTEMIPKKSALVYLRSIAPPPKYRCGYDTTGVNRYFNWTGKFLYKNAYLTYYSRTLDYPRWQILAFNWGRRAKNPREIFLISPPGSKVTQFSRIRCSVYRGKDSEIANRAVTALSSLGAVQ